MQTYLASIMETKTPVGSYVAQWGEGPIWVEDALYYVDIEGHKVLRYIPEINAEESWEVGERVGTVVPRQDGGLIIGGDNGFSFFDDISGEVENIFDPETEKENNRFNDGKCSPDGKFFAGSISLVKNEGDASLYCLDKDLSVSEVYQGVTNSNGIAWNASGDTMYYIDTPRREIMAFDYADGKISAERVVVDTKHIDASPDGMTIDFNGNLWVAFCHGACVACFNPKTGKEEHRVEIPCLETTACAFGGEDLSDLYITTGIHKTEEEEHAGRLWKVSGLGVKGVPSSFFAG